VLSANEVAASWYHASDPATLVAQGDQIWGLDLLDATVDDAGAVRVNRVRADLVVLSQSRDLEHEKVATVLAAPMYSLGDWLKANPLDLPRLEDIRRGYDPSLYLLPAWPDAATVPARLDRLVSLAELRVIRYVLLATAIRGGIARVVLSSPAREHFSQAVARTFMRVGLPVDIPSFELKRQSEEEIQIHQLPLEDGVVRLAKVLRLARRRYVRPRTGDVYWLLMTKGHNPAVIGAGFDDVEAVTSLASQFNVALGRLRDGDPTWSWLAEYLG
jgi:hypothetical protein